MEDISAFLIGMLTLVIVMFVIFIAHTAGRDDVKFECDNYGRVVYGEKVYRCELTEIKHHAEQ